MSDEETYKYVRCPSKMLKARIICETVCKDRKCLYHPNYRERISGRRSIKRDLLIPDPVDDVKPIKGIKGRKTRRKK
jgi:hypothetical protein